MMKLFGWFIGLTVAGILVAPAALAEESKSVTTGAADYRTVGLAVSAALAIALSVLGAGYAVARIGSAAMGASAEKPEILTRSILFVALAEGLAVLGFAIAMMILQKI
jgi:V/A-type H+-transporting ATPase subunit K